ncbi:DUF362 domain-containing protein [Occallatibacter savannae]|uniref:DUF362 domain-containing protein n=1 Tax=Occallatibacter savannae TaxID=1002691 RepID=UPI000D6908C7|nr:DUF362 domain-containing protein [Occallatibacter savannae]
MTTRREFMKDAATGALVLGAQSSLGLKHSQEIRPEAKSRVVVARDPSLHGAGGRLDEARVPALLDRAIASYTGMKRPVDAWRQIVSNGGATDKVIGLKTNGLGGKGISTHSVLVMAIAERLQQAGVKPGNILIWDRNARDLQACGFTINTDRNQVRCYGSDISGFEDEVETWGSSHVRFSKILTRECAMVINVPILKDHSMAGVTFAMKNMYGVVERPQELHAAGCNPAVADLNAFPVIRQKVRLTIGDAMTSVYEGGPGFRPEHLWQPNALIVGQDRVAIDQVAWGILDKKRVEMGLKTLEAAGRPPRYIATAADSNHDLGTNDPQRIKVVEV